MHHHHNNKQQHLLSSMQLHPLDWTGYLHRALVLTSTPTALTLLVFAAHCHALCSSSFSSPPLLPSSFFSSMENESSVLGSIFAGTSWLLFGKGNNNTHTQQQQQWSCIPTPWHNVPLSKKRDAIQNNHTAEPPLSEQDKEEDENTATTNTMAEGILKATIMKDPFSVAFSAWEFLFQPEDEARIQIEPLSQRTKGKTQLPKSPSSCEWMMKKRKEEEEEGSVFLDEASSSSSSSSRIWANICIMHGVGMLSVLFALLPSIIFVQPSMLACNQVSSFVVSLFHPLSSTHCFFVKQAIPQVKGTAWPVIHSCALLFSLSWVACSAIQHAAHLPGLAMCTSMHLVAQLMCAFVDMAASCPLPPIYMPGTVAATGMGFGLGLLLLCISQMQDHSAAAAEAFYMHHVWAASGAVFIIR
jgi:hypothetical protein